jgi:hypothetical protein
MIEIPGQPSLQLLTECRYRCLVCGQTRYGLCRWRGEESSSKATPQPNSH